jgi:hypothetical protein
MLYSDDALMGTGEAFTALQQLNDKHHLGVAPDDLLTLELESRVKWPGSSPSAADH